MRENDSWYWWTMLISIIVVILITCFGCNQTIEPEIVNLGMTEADKQLYLQDLMNSGELIKYITLQNDSEYQCITIMYVQMGLNQYWYLCAWQGESDSWYFVEGDHYCHGWVTMGDGNPWYGTTYYDDTISLYQNMTCRFYHDNINDCYVPIYEWISGDKEQIVKVK